MRLYGEEKLTSLMLKVSVDGKVYGREKQPMVAVGITPLDIGEKVSQQSCYSVFPLGLICGTEDKAVLENFLSELWNEMKKVVELKKVEWEEEDGKTTRVLECFWRCVTDLSACWKLYDFAGFNQHQNCPFCDVEDTKQRSDLDLIWGTWDWKEAGGKKEKLKNLMGMSLKLYCVCSLHMMMRVVNYLVSWLYGVFGEGCQERKFKKFFERIGVGWTAYEDLETGKRRFKSYGGAECKKILEHSRELDGMLKKYEDEIKQWKIGEEKKKEKPKKKKLGKKGNKGKGKGKGKEKGKGKGGKKEKEKEKEKEKRKEEKNEEVIDRTERGGPKRDKKQENRI